MAEEKTTETKREERASLRELAAAQKRIEELEAEVLRLSSQEEVSGLPRPEDDFVMLGGKLYSVLKTVRANHSFDEVKKGHIDEGNTLVVIDRKE